MAISVAVGVGDSTAGIHDIDVVVGRIRKMCVLPMEELAAIQRVYPCSWRGKSRYEKYRQAWWIFRDGRGKHF